MDKWEVIDGLLHLPEVALQTKLETAYDHGYLKGLDAHSLALELMGHKPIDTSVYDYAAIAGAGAIE